MASPSDINLTSDLSELFGTGSDGVAGTGLPADELSGLPPHGPIFTEAQRHDAAQHEPPQPWLELLDESREEDPFSEFAGF